MSIELDRRIAEEVMGEPEPIYPIPENAVMRGSGIITSGHFSKGGNWEALDLYEGPTWRPRPFSTHYPTAESAVDKVFEGMYGKRLTIEYFSASSLAEKYYVHFGDVEAWGESAPEAICRFLLAFKGAG